MFLILCDGATNLTTTMSLMTDYFEKYQIIPKVAVADQAFMTAQLEAYFNRNNIKPVATGPGTP